MQNKCIILADNVEQDYLNSLEISKVEIKKGNLQLMVRLKLQSVCASEHHGDSSYGATLQHLGFDLR